MKSLKPIVLFALTTLYSFSTFGQVKTRYSCFASTHQAFITDGASYVSNYARLGYSFGGNYAWRLSTNVRARIGVSIDIVRYSFSPELLWEDDFDNFGSSTKGNRTASFDLLTVPLELIWDFEKDKNRSWYVGAGCNIHHQLIATYKSRWPNVAGPQEVWVDSKRPAKASLYSLSAFTGIPLGPETSTLWLEPRIGYAPHKLDVSRKGGVSGGIGIRCTINYKGQDHSN